MSEPKDNGGNVRLNDWLGDLSPLEKFWVWVIRENQKEGRKEIRKQVKVGKLKVEFHWRSKKNRMGRFGGGWNWKLGFMAGGKTTIVSLLVCDVRFDVVA